MTLDRPRTAAVVALAVTALVLSACASSGALPPITPTATVSPSPSPTESPSPSVPACPGTTSPGAVYYVADVAGQGARLYREFTKVAHCPGGVIGGAVQTMFAATSRAMIGSS